MFLFLAFSSAFEAAHSHPLINSDVVDQIRSSGAAWQAYDPSNNPLSQLNEQELVGLCGTILDKPRKRQAAAVASAAAFAAHDYPREFDARKVFKPCLHPIRNQLKCGSCWAFSTAETWADNACILGANVTTDTVFSTEDLLSCATFGSGQCGGGRINYAFDYVVSDGLVTETCFPYTSQNGSVSPCPPEVGPEQRTCPTQGEKWQATKCNTQPNDLFTPDMMKYGIMKLGAVATGYTVFQDFYNYKSGIYKHVTGKMLGGHAIKVVGWGVQNATATTGEEEYWIVANSWGADWGEEGYFRFSFNDTDCHFGEGGAYNCGEKLTPIPPAIV
mmetsp:Transcript_4889/g.9455  ORF Transcript_4889/g.9455 Transcript_4889/m.9455 type:complete len:331 (-) Transcript_4889:115-1107(-)